MNNPLANEDHEGPDIAEAALIYVVDDEAMLLELASAILAPLGQEVRTFRDAGSALAAYAEADCKPGLIITDNRMQEMTGIELIAACRKLNPAQKILLLTGTIEPGELEQAPSPPDRLLTKPYHPAELLEAVAALLQD